MTNTPIAPINEGERHILIALVVDKSSSMMGNPIDELNICLKHFKQVLQLDSYYYAKTDITIISFNNSVQIEIPFMPTFEYQAPELIAGGEAALNGAITTALDALDERKQLYRKYGISYYCPWLIVLSGSKASDDEIESSTKDRLRDYIKRKKVIFTPIGIEERTDAAKLQEYYPEDAEKKRVILVDTKNLNDVFAWLIDWGFYYFYVKHYDPDKLNIGGNLHCVGE